VTRIVAQLRTTDLEESIEYFTTKLGCELAFRYQDFYAGIRFGDAIFHLKLVDEGDPDIDFIERNEHFHLYFEVDDLKAVADQFKHNDVVFVMDLHETPWGAMEFAIRDNQGHILYFGGSG
jgi:catechol 2,3-dioxygenase-like lactoylglutathione lyase family enzyme